MNILAYVESVPYDTAIEGMFYVRRAFEHAAWPKAIRPDIFTDHPDCLPGPESRALTLAILAGIEAEQQKEIDQLDEQAIRLYSCAMSEAAAILDERDPEFYPDNGEELLRRMRAEWAAGAG
ncbi:hypothetical protein GJ697_05350 [Pseudoduganella sp. FT25W]|uniref:Uncharacterized protein n=1 Tax=Duganella alba TaxID=2666081 RepID=A0A6L5QBZ6_9BURK|nr:hypothetical protein [Duganella alba]MRX07257.1 hypothetical protein [Duganella alba]MRX15048.1 hypothetical protein [Duganella alba]